MSCRPENVFIQSACPGDNVHKSMRKVLKSKCVHQSTDRPAWPCPNKFALPTGSSVIGGLVEIQPLKRVSWVIRNAPGQWQSFSHSDPLLNPTLNNANPLILAQRLPPQFVQSVSRGIIIIIIILYNPWRQLGKGFVPAPRRWFAPDSPSRLELITLAQWVFRPVVGGCCCDLWLPVCVCYIRGYFPTTEIWEEHGDGATTMSSSAEQWTLSTVTISTRTQRNTPLLSLRHQQQTKIIIINRPLANRTTATKA